MTYDQTSPACPDVWHCDGAEVRDENGLAVRPAEIVTRIRELQEQPPRCVYPDCSNTRRTRGVCHQHYQTMRAYVRDGKACETDLIRRGLLLPKGTGGSSVQDHSAFLKGSDARGRA